MFFFIIFLYIFIMLSLGFFIYKRGFKNIREWALEKNEYGWFVLTMTTFATVYSAFTFVGMPSYFAAHGIGTFIMVTIPAGTTGAILFYFVANRVMQLNQDKKVLTPLELLSQRISDGKTKAFLIIVTVALIIFNFPYIIIQIVGIGGVLKGLSGGTINYELAAFFMLICIFLYATFGGLKGIIWTDVFQGIFGLIIMGLLCYFFVDKEWGSLGAMFAQVKEKSPEHLGLPGPSGKMNWGFLISNIITIGFFSISYIQVFSRLLLFHSKKAILKSTIGLFMVSWIIGIIVLIIGIGAAIAFPNIKGDQVIVSVIQSSPLVTYFGELIAALFFVGVLAGAMSTADSVLFTLATVFSKDIVVNTMGREIDERKQKQIIKIFIFVFLTLCYVLAISNPPKFIINLAIEGIAGIAILAPTFLFLLWKPLKGKIAFISVLIGYSVYVILQLSFGKALYLNASIPAILISTIFLFIASRKK